MRRAGASRDPQAAALSLSRRPLEQSGRDEPRRGEERGQRRDLARPAPSGDRRDRTDRGPGERRGGHRAPCPRTGSARRARPQGPRRARHLAAGRRGRPRPRRRAHRAVRPDEGERGRGGGARAGPGGRPRPSAAPSRRAPAMARSAGPRATSSVSSIASRGGGGSAVPAPRAAHLRGLPSREPPHPAHPVVAPRPWRERIPRATLDDRCAAIRARGRAMRWRSAAPTAGRDPGRAARRPGDTTTRRAPERAARRGRGQGRGRGRGRDGWTAPRLGPSLAA